MWFYCIIYIFEVGTLRYGRITVSATNFLGDLLLKFSLGYDHLVKFPGSLAGNTHICAKNMGVFSQGVLMFANSPLEMVPYTQNEITNYWHGACSISQNLVRQCSNWHRSISRHSLLYLPISLNSVHWISRTTMIETDIH